MLNGFLSRPAAPIVSRRNRNGKKPPVQEKTVFIRGAMTVLQKARKQTTRGTEDSRGRLRLVLLKVVRMHGALPIWQATYGSGLRLLIIRMPSLHSASLKADPGWMDRRNFAFRISANLTVNRDMRMSVSVLLWRFLNEESWIYRNHRCSSSCRCTCIVRHNKRWY